MTDDQTTGLKELNQSKTQPVEAAQMIPAIHEKIEAFASDMAEEHHRYRSWELCYNYFHQNTIDAVALDRDRAALELGFYLASWGMYRGSSFLLQHAYTVHRGAIDVFVAEICRASIPRVWSA